MQRSGVGGGSADDNGVFHGAILFQRTDHLGHRRALLPNGDVDADQVFALLVDDRVQGNGRLTSFAVADDQFALTATNRNHGVNRRDTRRHRFIDRLTLDHARGHPFHAAEFIRSDGAFAINRLTDGVDDTANQGITDRHGNDTTSATHQVAFLNVGIITHDDDTNIIFGQILYLAQDAIFGKFNKFAGHRAL